MSTYLDFSNMGEDFCEANVEYATENPEVAIAWDGRILATGVGTTDVIVIYENVQQRIVVNVLNEVSEELRAALEYCAVLEADEEAAYMTRSSGTSEERAEIIEKSTAMVYLKWKPTSNLTGWRAKTIYQSGTTYTGIPYSQTIYQVDENGFASAMSKSDFYTSYFDSNGVEIPRYGNDCSGFVSFAWGISRTTTYGFYNNYESIGDYSNLRTGDAVVYRNSNAGHIKLIMHNCPEPSENVSYNEPYVDCHEQTPYLAQLTFDTYSQMQANGYKAISKFN